MIFGISGQAGSGKDTCADFLEAKYSFAKVALADPLKRICQDVYGFSKQQLWGPSKYRSEPDKRYKMPNGEYLTPRHALQTLGTEWARDNYENTWVDYAIRIAKELSTAYEEGSPIYYDQSTGLTNGWHDSGSLPCPHQGVAIPDCRFRNEIDAIKESGGKVIRVIRPGAGLDGAAAAHRSEAEMRAMPDSLFDHVIVNDGSLEELEVKVVNLVKLYR